MVRSMVGFEHAATANTAVPGDPGTLAVVVRRCAVSLVQIADWSKTTGQPIQQGGSAAAAMLASLTASRR